MQPTGRGEINAWVEAERYHSFGVLEAITEPPPFRTRYVCSRVLAARTIREVSNMAPPAQSRGGTPDYEHWFAGRGDETQEKKRTGKLPIPDTMGSNLAEETVLEFSWQRNGLRTLRANPL